LQDARAVGASDRELRRDREVVASAVEQAAQILLGFPDLITRGGIDERAARACERVEDPWDVLRRGAVAPPGAEGARAEREGGDPQTVVAAEGEMSHASVNHAAAEFIRGYSD
jgi:hypothetical protein